MDYQAKMAQLKKAVNITFIISSILSLAIVVLLICYNFAGVFTIQTLPGTKYENAFTYPGWQTIYYGVGEMIIQGYTEFTFDIFTCIGLFLPLIATIVCQIMFMKNKNVKGTNKKKAILEFIMAGVILFGGIMLFNCDAFSVANAKNVTDSYTNFYEVSLVPAMNGEVSFTKTAYPYILLIVSIVTALVKACDGYILLLQKKTAKKAKEMKGN